MTNQNDTQDEAERLAEPFVKELLECLTGADMIPIVLRVYRAGQASKEHALDISEQAFKLAIKDCKALIEENEMLRKGSEAALREIKFMQEKQIPAVKEQLAAERSWSKSAFDCLNHGAEIMKIDQLGSWTGVRAVIESYDSTDSGDGEKG